ncbi:hypothetical protein B0T14DRAFT_566273 [Immersiella caudata]|uniref:Uncharacterized protein n=1 Tax=Immersiella caudata TaxID=314043 RepID=A0AA40BZQ1_9PEZI|nr:hypothetical protein B0T14DRAFT_566273 [Immersiella caudata]
MASFGKLIRFKDEQGNTKYGEPIVESAEAVEDALAQGTLEATVYDGSDISTSLPLRSGAEGRGPLNAVKGLLRESLGDTRFSLRGWRGRRLKYSALSWWGV